jgi:hypothetical protein
MDLEVVIEGVPDVRVAHAIKRKIQQVCKDSARPGPSSVVVTPSETRGQWDIGLRDPAGWRVVTFTERIGQLPELIAAHLRACL